MMAETDLITVTGLGRTFTVRRGIIGTKTVKAVDDVNFTLAQGETLALIGESGSGKTTVGRMMLGLLKPTAGAVLYKGEDLKTFGRDKMRHYRMAVQAVFQDPHLSLNPRMTVEQIISEPLRNFGFSGDCCRKVGELLDRVGLTETFARYYPHQCSGGQKQRVAIARALALKPQVVILDEPLSALDITVQSQIISLLRELKKDYHISYLFITHDLRAVRALADRVAVLYRGRIVEVKSTEEFIASPEHPHSRELLAAEPRLAVESVCNCQSRP